MLSWLKPSINLLPVGAQSVSAEDVISLLTQKHMHAQVV